MERVFDSKELPPADRFERWYELTTRTYVPTVMNTRHRSDFRANARVMRLGSVQINAADHSALSSRRTARLIRQSDPGMYVIGLIRRGKARFSQAGRDSVLSPRHLLLYDTSKPFATESEAEYGGLCAEITVHFPRALLPLPPCIVDDLVGRRLPGDGGVRGLLRLTLDHLTSDTGRLQPADAVRMEGILLDLMTCALAGPLDAGALVPPETRRTALTMRIRAFVERHLGDPRLSPALIADAHHVSLRYLQRNFQQEGHTVTGWIRRRRLERCRRDLADPLLAARPVQWVAERWGFPHPQHFSRAFRTAYGMSPKEYRSTALYESA